MSKQKNYTVQDLEKMVGKHGVATTAPAPMTVVTVHEVPPRPPKAKKARAKKAPTTKASGVEHELAQLAKSFEGKSNAGLRTRIRDAASSPEPSMALRAITSTVALNFGARERILDVAAKLGQEKAAAKKAPKKAAAKKAPKKAAAKKAPKKAAAKKAPKAAAKKAPKKAAAKKAPKKAAAKKAPKKAAAKKAPKKAAAKKAPKKAAAKKAPKLVGARVVSKVDGDTGRVISVQGHRALVGWDQGVQTHTDVRDLRVV